MRLFPFILLTFILNGCSAVLDEKLKANLNPNGDDQNPSELAVPRIPSGNGFQGSTAEPAPAGSASQKGYDARAIARWDVVPNQRISGDINIGVVAFHISGIDRVEIFANGGAPAVISEMKLNPETNVVEYFGKLHAADFADGRVELRAIIYPKVGLARVLQGESISYFQNPNPSISCQVDYDGGPMPILDPIPNERSLILFANAHGTLLNSNISYYVSAARGNDSNPGTEALPFRSIAKAQQVISSYPRADGIKVFLFEGTYDFAGGWYPSKESWITFASHPSVANPDSVVILSGATNLIFNYLKFERLKMQSRLTDTNFFVVNSCWSQNRNSWLDHVKVQGGSCIPTAANPNTCDQLRGLVDSNMYMTDSLWDHITDGPKGARLIRNVTVSYAAGVVFQNSPLILNATVDTIERGYYDIGIHTDVIQFFSPPTSENIIFYGMRATNVQSIGLNIGNFTNSAIVNYFVDKGRFNTSRDAESVQLGLNNSHLLFWHTTFLNTGFVWYVDLNNFHPHLIDFRGNIFSGMGSGVQNGPSSWTASPEASARISSSPEIHFESNHFSYTDPFAGIRAGTDVTEGAISLDSSGKPLANSNLKNRVSEVLVPFDLAGVKRESNPRPSLGAYQ